MDALLDQFISYLTVERGLSSNTLEAYSRDLILYVGFLSGEGITSPAEIRPLQVASFIAHLRDRGLSPRSRARALSALRMFHRFLLRER
ncbi:MAG TPA: site-specific integrase, partial [Geobacterales bacterium]|nr:site-specific integrase [Geobacterales bacterium]